MGVQNGEEQQNIAEIYPFLTSTFLGDILRKYHDGCQTVTVKDFKLDSAVPAGENFCSQMVRADVEYSVDFADVQTKKLILKLSYTKESLNAKVEEINAFGKEIIMFSNVLPQVETLLRGIGDDVKLAAKCYASGQNPKYLCFEDLTLSGYHNVDKNDRLSAKHLHPLFSKLAKYHAATAHLLLDKKIDTKPFLEHSITSMTGGPEYFQSTLQLASNAIDQWGGYEEIAEKLRKLNRNYVANVENNLRRNLDDFLVLSHGDLWSNNVMYKIGANGDVQDVLMVDFQIGYWGSPVHDITYCLFLSGNTSIIEEDLDLAVQTYHRVLVKTLKDLNYPMEKVPTLRQLRKDLFQRIFFEFILMLQMSAWQDKKMTFDIEELFNVKGPNEKQKKLFYRPEFRKYSEPWLKYMDRKGLLDNQTYVKS